MNEASRPNRRGGDSPADSGAPGYGADRGGVLSSAGEGFVFEYHDEVLRRRAALSAENFLSDLASALDAKGIAEAEEDSRRAEIAAKEVARRMPAYEALLAALREIERLERGDA